MGPNQKGQDAPVRTLPFQNLSDTPPDGDQSSAACAGSGDGLRKLARA